MHRSRRIAAAATASTLAVAGAITGFAITAGNAGATVATGCQQIVPTSSASPSPSPGGTSTASPTQVTCTATATGIASPANAWLTLTTNDSQKVPYSITWKTQCYDANHNPYSPEQSPSPVTGTVASTTSPVIQIWMGLTPSGAPTCDITANLTATLVPSDTVDMEINYTPGASSTSATASATPTASSSQPSGGGGLTGIVQGFGGKCLDDLTNSSKQRATVAIWRCNSHDRAQSWTYAGGELKHNGLCLNAKGNAKNGSKLILWSCDGAPNEIWVFNTINHQVLLKAHGYSECINDPGYSTKNGTQLIVWSCVNTPNEHWSTP